MTHMQAFQAVLHQRLMMHMLSSCCSKCPVQGIRGMLHGAHRISILDKHDLGDNPNMHAFSAANALPSFLPCPVTLAETQANVGAKY